MALQVNDVLDQIQTFIDENNKTLRQRLLKWMNHTMKEIADMRDWDFLLKYADLTITDGEVTLPADFKEFINLAIGDTYFFDRTSNYTEIESWIQYGNESDAGIDLPVSSGTATLKYKIPLPEYDYGDTTIFPTEFINAIVDGTLCKFYKYMRQWEDFGITKSQYKEDLNIIKLNYNRNQPVPKYSSHGYLRRRQ